MPAPSAQISMKNAVFAFFQVETVMIVGQRFLLSYNHFSTYPPAHLFKIKPHLPVYPAFLHRLVNHITGHAASKQKR